MINPQWLELPMSRTNFQGPKDVRAIEVRLYFSFNKSILLPVKSRPRWLSRILVRLVIRRSRGSISAGSGNIISWRLIMKYVPLSLPLIQEGQPVSFLAKECPQYWLTSKRTKLSPHPTPLPRKVWLGKLTLNSKPNLLCFRHLSESRFLLGALNRRSNFANFCHDLMQNHLS